MTSKIKSKSKTESVIEDDVEPTYFSCPMCTFSTDNYEESDEHLTEHMTEYQSLQEDVFGKFSK